MRTLKHIILTLATASLLSAQANASESQAKNLHAMPVVAFSQTDINAMFDQADRPMQLVALSQQEMKETEGAWVWWAAGAAVGGAVNAGTYIGANSNWTYGGAAYAFLTGASGALVAGLPVAGAARLAYTAVGGYIAMQPWGGYEMGTLVSSSTAYVGNAFWWCCICMGPMLVAQSGLLPKKLDKLIYLYIGYATLVTAIAWLVWDFKLFDSILWTWVITVSLVAIICFIYRRIPNIKD